MADLDVTIPDAVMKDEEGHEWPVRLHIRDTKLRDDMGGGGQRIYTTAGRGYKTVEYIRADAITRSPPPNKDRIAASSERERVLEEALRALPPETNEAKTREYGDDAGPRSPLFDAGWNEYRRKAIRSIRALASQLRPEGEVPDYELELAARAAYSAYVDSKGYPNGCPDWDGLPLAFPDPVPLFNPDGQRLWRNIAVAALSARPQPPQQPVGWRVFNEGLGGWVLSPVRPIPGETSEPLYAAPLAQPVTTAGEEREKLAKLIAGIFDIECIDSPQRATAEIIMSPFEMADHFLATLRPSVTQPNAEEAGK